MPYQEGATPPLQETKKPTKNHKDTEILIHEIDLDTETEIRSPQTLEQIFEILLKEERQRKTFQSEVVPSLNPKEQKQLVAGLEVLKGYFEEIGLLGEELPRIYTEKRKSRIFFQEALKKLIRPNEAFISGDLDHLAIFTFVANLRNEIRNLKADKPRKLEEVTITRV
jgi:hypothetical protein